MIWGLELHTWEEIMRGSLVAVGAFGLIGGLATWFVVSLQRGELGALHLEPLPLTVAAWQFLFSKHPELESKLHLQQACTMPQREFSPGH